jgi:hypothetical protein
MKLFSFLRAFGRSIDFVVFDFIGRTRVGNVEEVIMVFSRINLPSLSVITGVILTEEKDFFFGLFSVSFDFFFDVSKVI